MKNLFIVLLATTTLASAAFAQRAAPAEISCQAAAEKAAVSQMNSELKFEKEGRVLEDYEMAAISNDTLFLDADDNSVQEETGTYGVIMTVMEECLDAKKVTTKQVLKDGKMSCEIIKVDFLGERDCG